MSSDLQWHLGTVGFGYKDWDGNFYLPKTPAKDYLKEYSKIFSSVEMDTTFYGPPSTTQIEKWRDITPEDFRFCFKTPRQITHDLHLIGVQREMQTFTETLRAMGSKLGPTLIQMPPNFTTAEFDNLVLFLKDLPGDMRFALEFRHQSWFNTEEQPEGTGWHQKIITRKQVRDLLAEHGIAWVTNDYADMPKEINATTDFLYFRFIGPHNRYPVKDHERIDTSPTLEKWKSSLAGLGIDTKTEAQNKETHIKNIYGYFNNDYSGHSPTCCNKFKRIMGLEALEPSIPVQASLF